MEKLRTVFIFWIQVSKLCCRVNYSIVPFVNSQFVKTNLIFVNKLIHKSLVDNKLLLTLVCGLIKVMLRHAVLYSQSPSSGV